MGTRCGSGASDARDSVVAIRGAIESARVGLDGAAPTLGLVFASSAHPLKKVLDAAGRALAIEWVACSSAGELTERGLLLGGVVVLLVAWDDADHRVSPVVTLDEDVTATASELAASYTEAIDLAMARGWTKSATLVLGDGLSPRFERLVTALRRATRLHHTIVGGGAADQTFERTFVGAGGEVREGGAVALHVVSKHRWGIGIGQGVSACSPRMTVTRAEGNVVHELDGRPILEVYEEHASARGETIDRAAPGPFLVRNELGIYFFEEIVRVRAGLSITPSGAVYFAGEVPEGASVAVVRGAADGLVTAAREAAEQARDALASPASAVLLFSCVTRAMVLGDRYGEELAAVRQVFGDGVPIVGFSTFGEVARVEGKLDGYHNHTLVVAAIPC